MNESPDKNLEKANQMKCSKCGGKGFLKTFDEKGRPDGQETCGSCGGSGNIK